MRVRQILASVLGVLTAAPALAQSLAAPLVAYDNGLGDGWQNWSWAKVEVPLKDLSVQDKTIDGFSLQGQADAYSAYFVTRIQFE